MTEREEALEEAAKVAEQHAVRRRRLAMEFIINPPLYSEQETGRTTANCIAADIRALKSSPPPPKGGEGWRDIESAPKDGPSDDLFLVANPHGVGIAAPYYTAFYDGLYTPLAQLGGQKWMMNGGRSTPRQRTALSCS